MKPSMLTLVVCMFSLSSCYVRSISNSGYDNNQLYSGELNEWSILSSSEEKITEESIQNFKSNKSLIPLSKHSRILVMQSGALIPDVEFSDAIDKQFDVLALSGIPIPTETTNPYNYYYRNNHNKAQKNINHSVRMAATQAGAEHILVYWGMIEKGKENKGTKTISWIPILGYFVVDEHTIARIRIKALIMDTKTGQWDMISVKPAQFDYNSAMIDREVRHEEMVHQLKESAFKNLANHLLGET